MSKSGPKKAGESLVALLLKTGSERFLHAAIGNHRRRSRGGGHGEVAADVVSRLAREDEEDEVEDEELFLIKL